MVLEDLIRLDVRWLAREGLLRPGRQSVVTWGTKARVGVDAGHEHFRLRYTQDGAQHDHLITLRRTACHYGGHRTWVVCAASRCRRRSAVLYLHKGQFVCRRCTGLLYASQQASADWRLSIQSWKLRSRLGCDWGPLDIPATDLLKPKGMHHATFVRMVNRLADIERKDQARFMARIPGLCHSAYLNHDSCHLMA